MKPSSSAHRIALIAAVVAMGATSPVQGFKFMSKFKRGPRIDAAAEARREEMFGDRSEFVLANA